MSKTNEIRNNPNTAKIVEMISQQLTKHKIMNNIKCPTRSIDITKIQGTTVNVTVYWDGLFNSVQMLLNDSGCEECKQDSGQQQHQCWASRAFSGVIQSWRANPNDKVDDQIQAMLKALLWTDAEGAADYLYRLQIDISKEEGVMEM